MTSTVSISAVGDILMWSAQIEAARTSADAYSFDYVFEEVAPILKSADLAIGNLETTLSGREVEYVRRRRPNAGPPMFNCPDELAGAVQRAGFHVVSTSNNHCLDRGDLGLKRTLDVLDDHSILHTGTYRSRDEAQQELICDVKGLKIGLAAGTYGTNGNRVPRAYPWMVTFADDRLLQRICRLQSKADLTIVCLHSGVEFSTTPSAKQREFVQSCFEHGADIVLGAHPHVVQPMESKVIKDIHGVEKQRFVIYSLGNFTSILMRRRFGTIVGLILHVEIANDIDGARITDVSYTGTWVNTLGPDISKYKVFPIAAHLEGPSPLGDRELRSLRRARAYLDGVVGSTPRSAV